MATQFASVNAYDEVLSILGLDRTHGRGVRIESTADPNRSVLSSKNGADSLIHARAVHIRSLDVFCSLLGVAVQSDVTGSEGEPLTPWPAEKTALPRAALQESDERALRTALAAAALGRGAAVSSYHAALAKHFFPMRAAVFAAANITVKAGHHLTIEPNGHDPVVVNVETLTLEEGGQIIADAPAILNVQKLVKTKPS